MNRPRYRIFAACLAFLVISIGLAMVYYPLSWGLMDDSQNLFSVRTRWVGQSLWTVLSHESRVLWFRPVYTGFVYVAYHLFLNHPKAFYLTNYAFLLTGLAAWGLVLWRQMPEGTKHRSILLFGFILLAATPLYNLVVYLSLQEKFLVFFGGWSVLCMDLCLERPSLPARWWVLQVSSLVFYLLALWSKPTTMALAPWAVLALLFVSTAPLLNRMLMALGWGAASGIMAHSFLQRKDSYSASYSTDPMHLVQKLVHQHLSVYVFLFLTLMALALIPRDQRFVRKLLWPITMLAYLAILIPWGVGSYLWAPAMVFVAGCLVMLVNAILEKVANAEPLELLLTSGMMLAATFIVFRVGIPRLERQSEIGPVVQWLSAQLPKPNTEVYVMEPCLEASHALEYYTGRKQEFHYLLRGQPIPIGPVNTWLITRDECVIDPAHESAFTKVLFQLPHWTIYEQPSQQTS